MYGVRIFWVCGFEFWDGFRYPGGVKALGLVTRLDFKAHLM